MTKNKINIVKICVGAKFVEELWFWQQEKLLKNSNANIVHVTRMRPRREKELLNGGSIYWIFKGYILARQRILSLDEVRTSEGVMKCSLALDPDIYLTYPVKKRPFQGWRYLKEEDSPKDFEKFIPGNESFPKDLKLALSELGIV